MESNGKEMTEFEYRVYRWGADEKKTDIARAFVIRTPRYGNNLDTYILLADEARKHFPEVRNEDILPGVVRNSGYMDGHAVISFNIPFDKPVPAPFKKSGRNPDFGY